MKNLFLYLTNSRIANGVLIFRNVESVTGSIHKQWERKKYQYITDVVNSN